MIRIKRNCDRWSDLESQAGTIINQFIEKGYESYKLEKTKQHVKNMNREQVIQSKQKQQNGYSTTLNI